MLLSAGNLKWGEEGGGGGGNSIITYISLLTQRREVLQQWIHWCVQSRTVCRGREVADIVITEHLWLRLLMRHQTQLDPDPMKGMMGVVNLPKPGHRDHQTSPDGNVTYTAIQ